MASVTFPKQEGEAIRSSGIGRPKAGREILQGSSVKRKWLQKSGHWPGEKDDDLGILLLPWTCSDFLFVVFSSSRQEKKKDI